MDLKIRVTNVVPDDWPIFRAIRKAIVILSENSSCRDKSASRIRRVREKASSMYAFAMISSLGRNIPR